MPLSSRKCCTDILQNKLYYDPFRSNGQPPLPPKNLPKLHFGPLESTPVVVDNSALLSIKKILKKKQEKPRGKENEAAPVVPSQNHGFSFNQLLPRRVQFISSPQFKKQLSCSLTQFNRIFSKRLDDLSRAKPVGRDIPAQTKPSQAIILFLQQKGFNNWVLVAEFFKKKGMLGLARIFYRLSIYKFPFEAELWLSWSKMEEQSGNSAKSIQILRVANYFITSEQVMSRLLRLGGPVEQVLDLLKGRRVQRFWKVMLEVGKWLQKEGQQQKYRQSIKHLYQEQSSNPAVVMQQAQVLYFDGQLLQCEQLLDRQIRKGCKSLALFSFRLRLGHELGRSMETMRDFVERTSDRNKELEARLQVELMAFQPRPQAKKVKELLTKEPSSKCFTLLSYIEPLPTGNGIKVTHKYLHQVSKSNYLHNRPFIELDEWKYCLHYSLFAFGGDERARKALEKACFDHGYAGRLLAEHIFFLRSNMASGEGQVLRVLKKYISQVPKSGQLWCEGGRFFLQCGNKKKALFCFQAAVELTPQYGDSYLQLLKLYLQAAQVRKIKKLKRLLCYNDPFYGNVWNFIKPPHFSFARDVFELAFTSFKKQVIQEGGSQLCCSLQLSRLVNKSQLSFQDRKRLLRCYQQLDHV